MGAKIVRSTLVLGRVTQQGKDTVVIGEGDSQVTVRVSAARRGCVTLAINAPINVRIDREEVRSSQ